MAIPPTCMRLHILSILLASALVGFSQDKIETADKTISFQNGVQGYSGAIELGIEKGKDALDSKAVTLRIGRRGMRHPGKEWDACISKEEMQALVRFDDIFGDKPPQIPHGAVITKASLRVWSAPGKSAASHQRFFLNRMLVPWDNKAAWENPLWGNDGIRANGKDAVAKHDTLFIPNHSDTAYDIDVTESLRAWAKGEANHGWVFRNTRNQYKPAAIISSRADKDSGRRPILTVSFDTAPDNKPPSAKNLSATTNASGSVTLSLTADDDGKEPLSVTFYGRKRAKAAPDFEIIVLPDTQYYTSGRFGGKPEMFTAQTEWIVKNHKARNIAMVLHLGDFSDNGDADEKQWILCDKAMSILESPKTTGLPDGIPYTVTVGNHDQYQLDEKNSTPDSPALLYTSTVAGPAHLYNKYFGVDRFKGRLYYGGHFGDSNNNYYTFFEAGSEKFIVISLEFLAATRNPEVLPWAKALLEKHSDRRGIVTTHASLLPGIPATFLPDGEKIYAALKACPNFGILIGGHISGEGYRTDEHNGSVVHSILQDFQTNYGPGGNGRLGILKFSPRENKLHVQNYSPYIDDWGTDCYGRYTLDYNFGTKTEPYAKLGETKIQPGASATFQWDKLAPDTDYEWFAKISDGQKTLETGASIIEAAPKK